MTDQTRVAVSRPEEVDRVFLPLASVGALALQMSGLTVTMLIIMALIGATL